MIRSASSSSALDALRGIRAIAFDADDTLWELQPYFAAVEHRYCQLLADYGTATEISASLFATETANMADMGYGCKAFCISLVENAVKVSRGAVSGDTIGRIVALGKSLLHLDATPMEGVGTTLAHLHGMLNEGGERRFRLAVFTKGELLDQENKLRRSGLARYFDVVSIVSDKTQEAYLHLCDQLSVSPDQLLMVGNSFKSDVAPALEIGAWAVHVPFHTQWAHELTEEYEHERLRRVENIRDIIGLL